MASMHFIGLDIHKKTISYCVKDPSGKVLEEGTVPATRQSLDDWMRSLPQPWTVAMEATMFTSWIYDYLLPHAAAVKVAHALTRVVGLSYCCPPAARPSVRFTGSGFYSNLPKTQIDLDSRRFCLARLTLLLYLPKTIESLNSAPNSCCTF